MTADHGSPSQLRPVSLDEAFERVTEPWSPRLVAELNGQHVRIARLEGEFVWHAHQDEDELFLVLDGSLRIELRDGVVELGPGELFVVPRGVEHRPVAPTPVRCLLFEPATTHSTGGVDDPRGVAPEDLCRG